MFETTQVLRDLEALGLDLGELPEVRLYRDEHDVLHTSSGCNIATSQGPVTVAISELARAALCLRCGESRLLEEDADLGLAAELLSDHSRATRPLVHTDPYDLRREMRSTQAPLARLRRYRSGYEGIHEQLGELAYRALSKRYDEMKEQLRTDEVRRELLSRCAERFGTGTGTDPVLATLRGYNPNKVADPLYDSLVISYWRRMPVPGNFVLLLPEGAYEYLHTRNTPQSWGTLGVAEPVLPGEDAEELAETVGGLWDPSSKGPMSELSNAVEAARLV